MTDPVIAYSDGPIMTVTWTGSVVAAWLGLARAAYVYRAVSSQVSWSATPYHIRALYFALWTLDLRALLGSYFLIVWIRGVVLYINFKAFR
ncbi:hypothetical protein N9H39_03700 [Gammaproteobacteria bacterium]|nr:hypothetical protein [Gammaproteobacteria bacterium]